MSTNQCEQVKACFKISVVFPSQANLTFMTIVIHLSKKKINRIKYTFVILGASACISAKEHKKNETKKPKNCQNFITKISHNQHLFITSDKDM